MALITPSAAGAALAHQAASGGGDTFANSGRERLHVVNADSAAHTVHVVKQAKCNFGQTHTTDTSDDFVVPAGQDRLLPAFDPSIYNDGAGLVHVTYTAVTSVTVGVIS